MLIKETIFLSKHAIVPMKDITILAANMKDTMGQLANQILALADGLKNATPEKLNPNKSVQYLEDAHLLLTNMAKNCDNFLPVSRDSQNIPSM